jgi:hypothetical protein
MLHYLGRYSNKHILSFLCVCGIVQLISCFRFLHPHSGKILEFTCPPPDDFAEVLDELQRITPSSDNNSELNAKWQ